jgi:hypothetical protein
MLRVIRGIPAESHSPDGGNSQGAWMVVLIVVTAVLIWLPAGPLDPEGKPA